MAMPIPPSRRRRPGSTSAPDPRSQKRRLLSRVVVALAAGLCLVGLEKMGMLDGLTRPGLFGSRLDWSSDYPLVQHLRDLVVSRGLTHDSKECLLFVVNGNDPPNAVRMRVMEKHSGTCPGEKGTLPLLFTLQVDRLNHTVQTDSGTPGRFHDLP